MDTMRVKVANGAVSRSEGKVTKIPFVIRGVGFESNAYMINLVDYDIVLGVA